MAFTLSGYLLDKPRMGAATNPFTVGPDNVISDQVAWNAAYPADESQPAADYMVLVESTDGSLQGSLFGWTKSESQTAPLLQVTRFGYDGKLGRYNLLPGNAPDAVGTLTLDSNTSRLKVTPPINPLGSYPVRISLATGVPGGVTIVASAVVDDAHFTTPSAGHVQISLATGSLNWAPADLVAYVGVKVVFQRQSFFKATESKGKLGSVTDTLLLSPMPATGQHPKVRIGYKSYLTDIETTDAGLASDPPSGQFRWSHDSGRIRLSSVDIAANPGKGVYYDGVLCGSRLSLQSQSVGTVASPGTISALPGSDVIFVATDGSSTHQFPYTDFVDAIDLNGTAGHVQILKSTGQIGYSALDVTNYSTWSVTAYKGDLLIEHGISLRLFRNPINSNRASSDINDVTALYSTTEATLVDPATTMPQVVLPALPLEDQPLKVHVEQNLGSFTSTDFPNLLTLASTDPLTLGYVLDFDQGNLYFAQRTYRAIQSHKKPVSHTVLANPLVRPEGIVIEVEQTAGVGDWQVQDLTKDAYVDLNSGIVSFTSTFGQSVYAATDGSITGNHFTAPTATAGVVQAGDTLIITSETVQGTVKGVYQVQTVVSTNSWLLDAAADLPDSHLQFEVRRGFEVLADRYFQSLVLVDPNMKVERILALGTISNAPRLVIAPQWITKVRFRYASGAYSNAPIILPESTAFSNPSLMTTGQVEIHATSGEVNFALVDVTAGGVVYWMRTLTSGTDYKLNAALGFIQFTDRMMEREEGIVTYIPTSTGVQVVEPMTFLVRKEVAQARTAITNKVSFNPDGHKVATTPPSSVWRSGRPQNPGDQVIIDPVASTVQFLPDDHRDDLLPHGDKVSPTENIYIDYYIYDAKGGEKTVTVQQPPMKAEPVTIKQYTGTPPVNASSFTVAGDWTATFLPNYLLRIGSDETHLIVTSTYDVPSNQTTVSFDPGDLLRNDYTNPQLFLSSGAVPVFGYFTTDLTQFDTVPRGSNLVTLHGDATASFYDGIVLRFSAGTSLEYALIQGSVYDSNTNRTKVTISANTQRQWTWGATSIKRTIRPLISDGAKEARTHLPPISLALAGLPSTMQTRLVYSKVDGQRGVVLTKDDYKFDDSGRVTFNNPLILSQAWCAMYTGLRTIAAGKRFRETYISVISPSDGNGLLGQRVSMDYTVYSPDTFYYRTVTMTTYRGELTTKYAKKASSSGGGGPNLQNSSATALKDQGMPTLFFPEGSYANEDVVGRSTLLFFNDVCNYLDDFLQDTDGRIVGGSRGRFLFDGNLNNPKRPPPPPVVPTPTLDWSTVTNQIDDQVLITPAPFTINFAFPNFSVTAVGTYQQIYIPGTLSRFFPVTKRSYGVSASAAQFGDVVLDTGEKNLTSLQYLRTRSAWAITTKDAQVGDTVLNVDNALGSADYLRPPFKVGESIYIQKRDGTFVTPPSPVPGVVPTTHVTSVSANQITINTPLAVVIPAGSTVYRSSQEDVTLLPPPPPSADQYVNYVGGRDYFVDATNGSVLYTPAMPPLDGSDPSVPASMLAHPITAGKQLSMTIQFNSTETTPERVPALFGGIADDDGEISFPVLSPSFDCEAASASNGALITEDSYVAPGGLIQSRTTAPQAGACNLDVTRQILTLVSGTLSPVPRPYDIVRLTGGLNNGTTHFYRIVSATSTSMTVDHPFPHPDTNAPFLVAACVPLVGDPTPASGTFTTTTLTDLLYDFNALGILPGYTIILRSGPYIGRRLQVNQVLSANQILFTSTLPPAAVGVVQYSISNPMTSYWDWINGSDFSVLAYSIMPASMNVLRDGQPPSRVWSETKSIEHFFDEVFTYKVVNGSGNWNVGSTNFRDNASDFLALGIKAGDMVYARPFGMFPVASVTDAHNLQVEQAFTTSGAAVVYQLGRPYGVSKASLLGLMQLLLDIDDFLALYPAFQALITTNVGVEDSTGALDTSAWAFGITVDDLNQRDSVLQARVTAQPSIQTAVENVLSSVDNLYERRFTWIDARINLRDGTLVNQAQAVQRRNQAYVDSIRNMQKLATLLAM
jgi:hypothetical protein